MFKNLTTQITQAFRELTGRDKITETMISQSCETIENALLEADVADSVIETILATYRDKILNTPIPPQANQGDFIIKLFHDELTEILGLSDRILVMREGSIVAELVPSETSEEQIIEYAITTVSNAA